MQILAITCRMIHRINDAIGMTVAWLALFLVLVQFLLVIMRYVFGLGSVLMQESLLYAHGTLYMLAAGYTLRLNGHVRVDVFYRAASARWKAAVDLTGVVFLLVPVCIAIWIGAWPYVSQSWRILEGSRETSGIPAVFLLKSVILVFVVLVLLQGLSMAIRSALVLAGRPLPEGHAEPAGRS